MKVAPKRVSPCRVVRCICFSRYCPNVTGCSPAGLVQTSAHPDRRHTKRASSVAAHSDDSSSPCFERSNHRSRARASQISAFSQLHYVKTQEPMLNRIYIDDRAGAARETPCRRRSGRRAPQEALKSRRRRSRPTPPRYVRGSAPTAREAARAAADRCREAPRS